MIEEIISNDYLEKIYALKNIIRYNTRNHIKNESVAEHSFYVALIGLRICEVLKTNKDITNEVLVKALLHDMPEIEINDITHDAKIRLNLVKYLVQYENDYYNREFPSFAKLMKKSSKLSAVIVDLADALSVKQFVLNEFSLGNVADAMINIATDADKRIAKLDKELQKLVGGKNAKHKKD